MDPRTPRNAKNLPNENSITIGQIPKGRWAAVVPPGGFNGIGAMLEEVGPEIAIFGLFWAFLGALN